MTSSFTSAYYSAWITAWAPNIVMALATIAFGVILRRHRRATGERHPWRLVAWVAAMTALVLAFNSSISAYSDALIYVHMLQHLLLIMVAPTLLVLADPWSMIRLRGGTEAQSTIADMLTGSRVWRFATSPIVTVPAYGAAVVLTHLTTFQEVAVGHTGIRVAENVMYLVVGYLLFSPLLTREYPPRIPYLLRFITIIGAMGADTLAGVSLMMTTTVLAPAYGASHPGWGMSAVVDQQVAGAVMWVGGDLIMMVLSVAIALMWGARSGDSGMGAWVDNIRRRQILGDDWDESAQADDADVDLDQLALDAYNAQLARLHEADQQR